MTPARDSVKHRFADGELVFANEIVIRFRGVRSVV